MRKLAIGLLTATGLAATGLVALSVPASAQGVWVGAGPSASVSALVRAGAIVMVIMAPAIAATPMTVVTAIAVIAEPSGKTSTDTSEQFAVAGNEAL